MKALLLSTRFPAHIGPCAGRPTFFPEKIQSGEKIHTIRLNEKNYWKDGDEVSLRTWTGKPYRSKQKEFHQCRIGVQPVRILINCRISEVENLNVNVWDLAKNDGLTFGFFCQWFAPTGRNLVHASILHFTDFRYEEIV